MYSTLLLKVLIAGLCFSLASSNSSGDVITDYTTLYANAEGDSKGNKSLLSNVFGDHMVLQRAPQQAMIWGFTVKGSTIKVVTTIDGNSTFTSKANKDGIWKLTLPPVAGSQKKAYEFRISSSSGESAEIKDVLFGDVFLCGGQSNMGFAMGGVENAEAEMKLGNKYPFIRLFTVGEGTRSKHPLEYLHTFRQKWVVASYDSLRVDGTLFGGFSAVCWYFGKTLADKHLEMGFEVPIGLISNNWGGTSDQLWSTKESLSSCGVATSGDGELFNAMIHPYSIGPMSLFGFTWYQGEADYDGSELYKCTFPSMITAWRRAFRQPELFFGFVQLSTWCSETKTNGLFDIPLQREAQMSALKLPQVGYATNADHGFGCGIHPPFKRFCAERLAKSALKLIYKRRVVWKSPSYQSIVSIDINSNELQNQNKSGARILIRVRLMDVNSRGLVSVRPYNLIKGLDCHKLKDGMCAGGIIYLKDGKQISARVYPEGKLVVLEGNTNQTGFSSLTKEDIVATSYGFAPIPLMNVYSVDAGLPVLPWYEEISIRKKSPMLQLTRKVAVEWKR